MNRKTTLAAIAMILLALNSMSVNAQRSRAQFPAFMAETYLGANVGYIYYPFSNQHLDELNFQAESTTIPNLGVRLMLHGRDINDYLSLQISYMRPVLWVVYRNLNGQQTRNSVWMNIAGLTLRPMLPLNEKLTLTGEFGLSIITRHGFNFQGKPVVKDANYATVMFGAGLKYRLNDNWDFMMHGVYSPRNKGERQPYTVLFAPGFQYNMRRLSDEKILEHTSTGYIFPKHQFKIGFSSNFLGYGVNAFFSEGIIPVFWGGAVEVKRGLSVNYQRNIFHGKKIFSFDAGVNASFWETKDVGTNFFTIAVYPLVRFTLLRTQPADFYFFYSAGGPAYISNAVIDDIDTGERFTFRDYMGIGTFAGPGRNINAEIQIGHYSNGNLFPQNPGVKVPLTFAVGYAF